MGHWVCCVRESNESKMFETEHLLSTNKLYLYLKASMAMKVVFICHLDDKSVMIGERSYDSRTIENFIGRISRNEGPFEA